MEYYITHSGYEYVNVTDTNNTPNISKNHFNTETIDWLKTYYKTEDENDVIKKAIEADQINLESLFTELKEYVYKYLGHTFPLELEFIYDTIEISQSKSTIYINNVMSKAFLAYIATQMYHSNTLGIESEDDFCYRYTLFVLNDMCFNNFKQPVIFPNGASMKMLLDKFSTNQHLLNLSCDIYFSAMAFAFLHEISHAYLEHSPFDQNIQKEIDADSMAFKIFLEYVDDVSKGRFESNFEECMLSHVYMAPMYLLEFYYMVYYTGSFLCAKNAVGKTDIFDGIVKRKNSLFDVFYNWNGGESEQDSYNLYNFFQDGQESFLNSFIESDKLGLLNDLKKRNKDRKTI